MKLLPSYRTLFILLCIALVSAGCGPARNKAEKPAKPHKPTTERFPAVTLDLESMMLDQAVRRIGEQAGCGLVLMNGLSNKVVPPLKLKKVPYGKMAKQLAEQTQCLCQETPSYYFLYPAGYEMLLNMPLEDKLSGRYKAMQAAFSFGDNTELFNVFMMISRNLGITLVGDNAVADSRCGELNLPDIPLTESLSSILKSARIAPGDLQVDCTDEYIFLYSAINKNPKTALLNEADLKEEQCALLENRVNINLPEPPENTTGMSFYHSATPLRKVLGTLSIQIGFPVVAEKELEDFPVNACVMNNVRVHTVLDLLVRQWLIPRFGYEVTGEYILIRKR